MDAKKSVQFADAHTFYFHPDPFLDANVLRASLHRRSVETALLRQPGAHLDAVRRLIASWREHPVSVVYGNLGRQPFLLTYYLDLCFGPEEVVRVTCDWPLASDYYHPTPPDEPVDFWVVVEPYFGYTVHKTPQARHLIVLTSHLNLSYSRKDARYYFLNLSNVRTTRLPDPNLRQPEPFRPPVFHHQNYAGRLPDAILLDVSEAPCAHEAYLRALTGREMIGRRPYQIRMSDRDRAILKRALEVNGERVEQLRRRGAWTLFSPFPEGIRSMGYFLCSFLDRPRTTS